MSGLRHRGSRFIGSGKMEAHLRPSQVIDGPHRGARRQAHPLYQLHRILRHDSHRNLGDFEDLEAGRVFNHADQRPFAGGTHDEPVASMRSATGLIVSASGQARPH